MMINYANIDSKSNFTNNDDTETSLSVLMVDQNNN